MKSNRNDLVLFWICISLFTVHQFFQKGFGIHIRLIDNYGDPLLAMPVILQLVVWERKFLYNKRNYRMPVQQVFAYIFLMSLMFEIVFPLLSDKFVSDHWDIFFYLCGGSAFAFFHHPYSIPQAGIIYTRT